jgi:signal transduction histidine kinase
VESGNVRRSDLTEFLDASAEMTTLIERSTQRAAELVSSFKQVAVDMSSERRREFTLDMLVNDIVASLKHGMRKREVRVEVNVPDGIHCDSLPGPVGQVLTNLVQNALTHGFANDNHGTITITAWLDGDMAVLSVHDDGVGMNEHTRKHCFDPFFTTRLGQGGSGLGLSVSYRLAGTVLHGSLAVQSQEGSGSTFTLRFLRQLPLEHAA